MANHVEQSDGFTYDVFLSFRGEDTRENIVAYLRDAFRKRGINAFYDDTNLEIGEELSPAFYKAIEESNISVIVFSENYASSKWCLNELAKIMECTKTNKKQIAFPIFYHVDPSDVRNQRNNYGKAMDDHKETYGKDSEKVKAWTAALSEVANLKGHHYHIHKGNEIDHVKEIAEKVHAKIAPKPLLVGEKPVGLDQRIEEVKSLLDLKPKDDTVRLLGIIGLGGIGKTELAKALYNKTVHQFEAASFLANVREKSKKINGLEDLQTTLLSEMFQQPETELGSTSKGIYEIKHKLGRKKVLLVLDDVDEMKQLENLAGGSDWYGPGSRIIITTRDKGLLIAIDQIEVKTYEMTELNYQHSLELFCRNAFGNSHPEAKYEDMSSRAVGYAKGLPLALKVIGSNLKRKSKEVWEDALKAYERIPLKEIQYVLKVSYDVLEHDAQSVFLDIACFFKGGKKEHVEEILSEFSAKSSIEELVNKSLLNVEDGHLYMHDLIQDMGREIVRKEAPNNPAERSRLWFHQDVIDVLSANASGCDANAIQGIMLDPPTYTTKLVNWNDSAFEKMHRLRVLIVRHTTFSSEPKHLPNNLRLLDWHFYPSKTFPPNFYPMKVIVLNLFGNKLTMEKPFKEFSNLTVMDFSHNDSITTMPDVSKVKNLRKLRLNDCKNLTRVHESIGFLKHLVYLSVSGCTKLEKFLQEMFLPSLEVLNLDSCEKLEHFPDIEKEMNTPLKIRMMSTSIKKLPDSVVNLIGLVSIDMQYCEKIEYLPNSTNLKILDVSSCSSLTHISELPCTIQKIDASHCLNFSSKTSDMLWDQVKKERHGLEILMHRKFIVPKWFDYRCKGGVPCLWVCGKFPSVALALLLQFSFSEFDYPKHVVQLHLVINGQHIFCKRYYEFGIRQDHVLVCDLRLLYNDEEWLSIDALLLENEWNQVQISYEVKYQRLEISKRSKIQFSYEAKDIPVTTSEWGVFVYKQGTDDNLEEHVQFMCPDPTRHFNESMEIKPAIGIGEASTSSHQGSSEYQLSSAEQQFQFLAIEKAIRSKGEMDGFLEACNTILLAVDMDLTQYANDYSRIIEEPSIFNSEVHAYIGNERCNDFSKHKNLAAVLKEREEELSSHRVAEMNEFRNSNDILKLIHVSYLHGKRVGIQEARSTLQLFQMCMFEKNEIDALNG